MAESRTTSPAELFIELERGDAMSLHHQVEGRLREALRSGRLPPGSRLPSSRTLADQLGLARGVVVEAYEQLVAEGYLTSRHGSGTRVSERPVEQPVATPVLPPPANHRIDFAYGRPDVTSFPRGEWLRSFRRVLAEMPAERLGYLDGRGAPELRASLATYLNRVRGTAADSERIVITNGFAQALDLFMDVLAQVGMTRIGVEEPGQTDTSRAAARHGIEAVPIPVDDEGLRVDLLEESDVGAVVVTPAHQFPLGAVLSAERRAALIRWAKAGERTILEDDYDAEYRYDRDPIGALQGLAPEAVLYAGSASKTLAPGLRLGWLVAPAPLVQALAAARLARDRGSPALEQLAFADFVDRGAFDHHLRRMRAVYRQRRTRLLDAISRHAPSLCPSGASAGLHVVAWLPPGVEEMSIISAAAEQGIRIGGVAPYRIAPGAGRQGLLFGYGAVSDRQIEEGVGVVADLVKKQR